MKKMLVVCTEHKGVVVINDYGGVCPLCKMKKQFETLVVEHAKLEGVFDSLETKVNELEKELTTYLEKNA